jgi:membrane carboxypeptidase/penicillin-binding protein
MRKVCGNPIPKAPNHYKPFRNAKAAISRRNLVLSRMKQLGCITERQYKEAIETPLLSVKYTSLKKEGTLFCGSFNTYPRAKISNKCFV